MKKLLILILIIYLGCNYTETSQNKTSSESNVSIENQTAKQKTDMDEPKDLSTESSIPTQKANSITTIEKPYTNPKNIDEVINSEFFVDTLTKSHQSNNSGENDHDDQVYISKIVGRKNDSIIGRITDHPLFPTQENTNKKVYSISDSAYIVPMFIDRYFDELIITIWKKEEEDVILSKYFKNRIFCKLSSFIIIDHYSVGEKTFLIGNSPGGDGGYSWNPLWVAEDMGKDNAMLKFHYYQAPKYSETDTIIYRHEHEITSSHINIMKIKSLFEINSNQMKLIKEERELIDQIKF